MKFLTNGILPNDENSALLNIPSKCSSSVGDLSTSPVDSKSLCSKYSSLSSQNVAVVSLSSSNSTSFSRRLPGSCNDINDFKNSNGYHSPSYNHPNLSPRFTFQVEYNILPFYNISISFIMMSYVKGSIVKSPWSFACHQV